MKKFFVLTLTVLFLGTFSVSYASTLNNDVVISIVDGGCDKCGKEDCKGCEAKKKECSSESKKACCAKGKKGSSSEGKEAKKETKEESKK